MPAKIEFSNILNIRIMNREYLIAMKLKSFRYYKNDISDIIEILKEHQDRNDPISLQEICTAVENLYGNWNSKEIMTSFDEKYPDIIQKDNINDIILSLKQKKELKIIIKNIYHVKKYIAKY